MVEIGIRALKQNASAVVRRVAAGESITVTDRGRPVARLVPLGKSRVEDLIESGRARPASLSLSELPPPVPVRPGRPGASEALEEMREGERY